MTRASQTSIRVGIGGWTFPPWRGPFYPPKLPHAQELRYASERLTAIEINGTYYGSQKPESFARWRDETPDGFVFAVKGPRFTTNRRVLAEAGSSIERFIGSGVLELRDKLGPINWQFLPTKRFEPDDFAAFLSLLPKQAEGRVLRHVVEVRHESFAIPGFVSLLREHGVATVVTDNPAFPHIPDITAPFVYARLQCASAEIESGYEAADLDRWAERATAWRQGGTPADLGRVADTPLKGGSRDVFVFFINGHKPKAPAAAMGLLGRLNEMRTKT